MRLIDADKLIILAENTFARPNGFIRLIEETETAYNVDAVVAELEKAYPINPYPNDFSNGRDMAIGRAIDIVRKGGAE